ncbi:hypothetical protein T09_4873 [Trichinella sp. T9]|nr:hypothetical protein T09_4873 [Trichinella sp. T9]
MPSTRSATTERPEENRQQLEEKAGTLHKLSENPRWIMPPEALTQSSDVERWFIRMERIFSVNNSEERYIKEFINRRQRENESVVKYAGHLKRLLLKAFPQLKDQADGILLQQF